MDADALVARVMAYSKRIPHFPARMKEWAWRNGAVVRTAEQAGIPILSTRSGWRAFRATEPHQSLLLPSSFSEDEEK